MWNFAKLADTQRRAAQVAPNSTTDPVDLVARAHPQLRHYDCIALPYIPCAESVLRLALALRDFQPGGDKFDLFKHAPPLQVRCPQATVNQLRRRLARLGMPDFPIYILLPPVPGSNLFEPEFKLAYPTMEVRDDHWSILYIPDDPHAPNYKPPHWTFTTILPTKPEVKDELSHRPMVVFTGMPITDPSEYIYWRCRPSTTNMEAYLVRRARGLACHCCQLITCVHELNFYAQFPKARKLSLEGNMVFDGEWRGQVIKSGIVDNYTVTLAPDGAVVVRTKDGLAATYQDMWNRPAIKRPAVDHGYGMVPWNYEAYCCPTGGALAALPYVTRTMMKMTMRLGNTFAEKIWPCYYWKYDIPRAVEEVRIRPYTLRLHQLERRRRGFPRFMVGAVVSTIQVWYFSRLAIWLATAGFRDLRSKSGLVYQPLVMLYLAYQSAKKTIRTMCYLAIDVWFWLPAAVFTHFKCQVEYQPGHLGYGFTEGLMLKSEKSAEVNSRLAVRKERTREAATDIFRRSMNETKWATTVTPEEFEVWLSSVVNTPGESPSLPYIPPGTCITCRQLRKTYRQECKPCKLRRTKYAPEPILSEPLVTYVGRVGLWSRDFVPPLGPLKPGVTISRGGKLAIDLDSALSLLKGEAWDLSCRGWNSGPIIDSNVPQCFPRGHLVSVIAFMLRLGGERIHQAQERPWLLWYNLISRRAQPLEKESRVVFLSHFHGDKREKMEEAFRSIDDGYAKMVDPKRPVCKMSGFPKAEKSYCYKYMNACSFEKKPTEKPRFICCPSPEFLAEIGPYTHAQLKWLSSSYDHTSHCFYAGCATPQELNQWLNWTLEELPEPVTVIDDIVAIDSNHSTISFKYHTKLRALQFPTLNKRIELLFLSEQDISIRIGPYVLKVADVNASGVPDTSYKNSAPCLLLRVFAILHGLVDLSTKSDQEAMQLVLQLIPKIFTSAAGDDGITRMPDECLGTRVQSPEFLRRYREWWAMAGFDVKVLVLPGHRWRMATYLAMRPVWGGESYQWAPEPARRLKGMFWQIDNSMHPRAWARGVATQVLGQGRHCPVLSDICSWFLERTTGPIAKVELNPHSPFAGYQTTGVANSRAEAEFCVDYHLEKSELQHMRQVLARTNAVDVNLGFSALRRVMLEES